jgi:hypothetical protein
MMKNVAMILQHRPDTRLHVENYSDPADGNISIGVKLQDIRTGKDLVIPLAWHYDFQAAMTELDRRCARLAKRWKNPTVNTGVR